MDNPKSKVRVMRYTSWSKRTTVYHVTLFSQPTSRYLLVKAYSVWERTTWRLFRRLEPLALRLHHRSCTPDHECGTGFTMGGQRVGLCAYLPYTNRQDIRYFNLCEAGKVVLADFKDVPVETYMRLRDSH